MRDIITFLLLITCPLTLPLSAQENASSVPVSRQIYSFSPLAHVYLNNLGLVDRNNNGAIERGAGEGYEEFIAKYGNADIGFHANYVLCGAANGKLEEPEIINYYYLTIRFKPEFEEETAAIESEVSAYVYANDMPLVWLDDEQGTVMNAVNTALGEGWNRQKATEDEAIALFNRAMRGMGIRGRTGVPDSSNGGYYTLPEFVTRKAGYCVEAALFGFWFFSQLKLNSILAEADLTSTLSHEVVKLSSGRIVDYFGTARRYNAPADRWYFSNPLQELALHYRINENTSNIQTMREQTALYDKYRVGNISRLIHYYNSHRSNFSANVIELGEFFLANYDIDKILKARHLHSSLVRTQISVILMLLLKNYSITGNRAGFENVAALLGNYYRGDNEVRRYVENYRYF